ncbi:MAG: hypothetical protein AAB152_10165 [Candidatus Coatesbacteria bacterium]
MVNTRYIHFRVTREQYDTIKTNANVAGCKMMSDYLRRLALNDTSDIQGKLSNLERDFEKTFELLRQIVDAIAKR